MKLKDLINNNFNFPYLIAEIGINHNGSMDIAKKLIDASYATNWHCVKFQKRNPDKAVPESQKNLIRQTPWGEMTYIDYKRKIEFNDKEFDYINDYCSQKPIEWSFSVWDEDSIEFSKKYNLPYLKIPSALNGDLGLIDKLIHLNKFLIVSTGMTDDKGVDSIVDLFRKNNFNKFALLHCNSSYPTPPDEINLNIIPELIKKYDTIVGYSTMKLILSQQNCSRFGQK